MEDNSAARTTFVSLQIPVAGAAAALDQHRAAGILTAPDEALLFRVPPDVLDAAGDSYLLVVSQPDGPDGASKTVERAEIRELNPVELTWRDQQTRAVAVRLAAPVAAAPAGGQAFTEAQLRDALTETDGDVAPALARLGVLVDESPVSALTGVPADLGPRERSGLEIAVVSQPHSGVDGLALSFCHFLPFCDLPR